jgi:hypothetical protein
MLQIFGNILNSFHQLRWFCQWGKGMDINTVDETSYTSQYQERFLKDAVNEYCDKRRRVPITTPHSLLSSNHISTAMASQSWQSSFDPYNLCRDHREYLMPNNVAETTHGQRNRAARLFTAAMLYLNSPSEAPKNWGQINPNHNDSHCEPMEFISTFWIPDITDRWR